MSCVQIAHFDGALTLFFSVALYYDYFLTIVPEYNLFWVDSRLSWTSFLFFLNRYSALVAHVPVLIQYFWNLPDHVSVSPYLYAKMVIYRKP